MKTLVAMLLCAAIGSGPAMAQSSTPDEKARREHAYQNGRTKFLAGLGIGATGVLLALSSSVSGDDIGSDYDVGATDKGMMALGFGMAGGGVYLAYTGRKQMKANAPSIQFRPILTNRAKGVVIRRIW